MPMLKAGFAVALVFLGAVMALLGVVLTLSALKSGAINVSYGTGTGSVAETITQSADAARYWKFLIGLGVLPVVLGGLSARWGWRRIRG
jgi:hypothetical protein